MSVTYNFKTFQHDPKRPRIGQSVLAILTNIKAQKATTAIIVPPRYGKSNIIRCTALEARETGIASCCVVLAPWRALRDQITAPGKITKMVQDMQIRLPSGRPVDMRQLTGDNISPDFWKHDDVQLWAMTLAGALKPANIEQLCDAATLLRDEKRPPLLVSIDEGHTVSGETGWGALAIALKDAGAHIVLLTGTPYRADNIAPFGFKTDEVERIENYEYTTIVGAPKDGKLPVERRRADKVTYKLIADVDCPLREAWNSGIITQLQARWFTYRADNNPLADIGNKVEIRRALATGMRMPAVTQEAVQLFVNDIAARRQSMPNSAGIVFTGNDSRENGKDAHARQTVAMIEKEWLQQFGRACDITIATQDVNGDSSAATAIIKRFVGDDDAEPPEPARGDVIVVKLMGGVGLDIPRLKTALDLSTIRTKGNTTQRWLRVATLWAFVAHGTLVLPDDPITVQLFEELVVLQGGQFTVMENVTTLDTIEVDLEERPRPTISDPAAAGSTDLDGGDIDEFDFETHVQQMIADFPALAERMTYPEIAKMVKDGLRSKLQATPPAPTAPAATASTDAGLATVVNKDAKKVELREQFDTLTKDLANRESNYGTARDEWLAVIKRWAGAAKRHAGIPIGMKTKKCNDIDRLQIAVHFLEQAKLQTHRPDLTNWTDVQ